MGIGVCNDVVMGMVVVAVVGYCSVNGCYFVVLEVLKLGGCGAMVVVEFYWFVGMIVMMV